MTKTQTQVYARLGGVLYLIIIAAGLFGETVRNSIMAGDFAGRAHRIIASEFLFRSSVAGDLVMHICDIPLTLILYLLLKPVSKHLSLLAGMFSFLQTAILCANKLNLVTVLLLLDGKTGSAFEPRQLQALLALSLSLHEFGFGIGLVFFGVSCLILGYLIFRSGYLPRTIGVLHFIAGVCYLVNSFALLLYPALADRLFPGILLPSFLGELATCLWLMVRGIDVTRWPGNGTMMGIEESRR